MSIFGKFKDIFASNGQVQEEQASHQNEVFIPRLDPSFLMQESKEKEIPGNDEAGVEARVALYNLRRIMKDEILSGQGMTISADIDEIKSQAEEGKAESQMILGMLHSRGLLVEKDLEKAHELLTKAAEQDSKDAKRELAQLHMEGQGCEKDEARAFEIYTEIGDDLNLGLCYFLGKGCEKDQEKAFLHLKDATAKGDPIALSLLILEFSTHDEETTALCSQALVDEATKVDADAEFALLAGHAFRTGAVCGEPNWNNAGFCYIISAIGGDKTALEMISNYEDQDVNDVLLQRSAECFEAQDLAQGFKCLEMAEERGSALALREIGCCYESGIFVEQDPGMAYDYFFRSHHAGCPQGTTSMAICHVNGTGCPKDYEKAYYLFKEAAEAGEPCAEFNLGSYYKTGKVVKKDLDKAIEWYQKAAEQGNEQAMCALGLLYLEDEKRDVDAAAKYLLQAAENGHVAAEETLKVLSSGRPFYCHNGHITWADESVQE